MELLRKQNMARSHFILYGSIYSHYKSVHLLNKCFNFTINHLNVAYIMTRLHVANIYIHLICDLPLHSGLLNLYVDVQLETIISFKSF